MKKNKFDGEPIKSPNQNMRMEANIFSNQIGSKVESTRIPMEIIYSNQITTSNDVSSMKCPNCGSDVNAWLHSTCLKPLRFSKNLDGSILCENCDIEKSFFEWDFFCIVHQALEKDLDLIQKIDFFGRLEQNFFKSPSFNMREETLDFLKAAQSKLTPFLEDNGEKNLNQNSLKTAPNFQDKPPAILEGLNLTYDRINRHIEENAPPEESKVKMINLQLTAQKQIKTIERNFKALQPQAQIFLVNKRKNVEILEKENEKMKSIIEELKITKEKFESIEKNKKQNYSEEDLDIDKKNSLMFLLQMVLEADKKVFSCKLQKFNNPESQLKIDSYLFTSEIIDFVVLFLCCIVIYVFLTILFFLAAIIHPICICLSITPFLMFDPKSLIFMCEFYFYMIPILGFSLLLLLPGVLVVFTQGFCIIKLAEEQTSESSSFEMGVNFISTMHFFFILFYLFFSLKKVKSSMKSLWYFLKVIHTTWIENAVPEVDPNDPNSISECRWSYVKKIILLLLDTTRLIPNLVQIFFCFWFSYININLIDKVENTTDLIQSFAALAFVLKFDKYIMNFFKYIGLKTIYDFVFQWIFIHGKKNGIFEVPKPDIQQVIDRDQVEMKNLLEKLDKGAINWQVQEINDDIEKFQKLEKEIQENIEQTKKTDVNSFITQLQSGNLTNILEMVPEFIINYFTNRNPNMQKLMTEKKFLIIEKYRVEEQGQNMRDQATIFITCFGVLAVWILYLFE